MSSEAAAVLAPETGGEYAARHTPAGQELLLPIPLTDITTFQRQPRMDFDLDDLVESIREHGQQQPVMVRKARPDLGTPWELVDGERRLRACGLAGRSYVLARVLGEVDETDAVIRSALANAHRKDLNPIELAKCADELISTTGKSQAEIARILGLKGQTDVSHLLRLRGLPAQAKQLVRDGLLTRSHGEALLQLARWPKELVAIAEQAVRDQLRTRDLEALVARERQRLEDRDAPHPPARTETRTPAIPPPPAEVSQGSAGTAQGAAEVSPGTAPTTSSAPAAVTPPAAAAAAPTPAPPASTAAEKPRALKSAEEIVAEKHSPPAEPPRPVPVSFPIPPSVNDRITSLGIGVLPAIRLGCDVTEVAREYAIDAPDIVAHLRWLCSIAQRREEPVSDVLGRMESLPSEPRRA